MNAISVMSFVKSQCGSFQNVRLVMVRSTTSQTLRSTGLFIARAA